MLDFSLLARRVADGLSVLVPSEVLVGADGTCVTIASSNARAAYEVGLDDHDAAVGLYAVLSNVQDFVAEHTASQWPTAPDWAEPKVVVDGRVAVCGYRRDHGWLVRFEVSLD